MTLEIRTTATPREILARRINLLFRNLPLALAGDQEAIHRLRVAGRRLRMAIPVLARKPGGRRVRRVERQLRDLIRTAGACRDIDVCLDLLTEARSPSDTTGPERAAEQRALARRLRAQRALTRHRMTEALFDLDVSRLRRSLRDLVARAESGPEVPRARLRDTGSELAAEIGTLHDDIAGRYLPVSQHRARTRLRRLRYLLELEADLSGAVDSTAEAIARLQALQGHLGRLHDAHVLSGWLLAQAARPDPLAGAARRLADRYRRRSRMAHRAWLAAMPSEALGSAREALDKPFQAAALDPAADVESAAPSDQAAPDERTGLPARSGVQLLGRRETR